MIKAIQISRVVKRSQDFEALVELFDSLGLERGQGWQRKRDRGVLLLAPEGQVKIGEGKGFTPADLHLEVTDADVLYEVARRQNVKIVSKIADTDWDARLFVLQAAGGMRVAIFSQLGKPVAAGLEGGLSAQGKRFGVVLSRFNAFITDRLLAGALDALHRAGAAKKDIEIVRVPGAFEIPAAARALAATGRFHAVVCLGCILRGETTHYEHLANEVTRGIGQSAQETGVPHAYGLLTCDSLEQAIDRAGLKSGNKGFEAGLSAVEMANLKQVIVNARPAARRGTRNQKASPRTRRKS
ncbi:MAG: 6,7-dimethyl-8-ribityllumazine synthase [Terriglobales bacterium]